MGDLVSADLLSSGPTTYRGYIDGFESESGLLGWALDLRVPAERLLLRFVVDGISVLDVVTSYPRPDVSIAIDDRAVQPGFCIPRSELQRLRYLVALCPTASFDVEIGTTSLFLPRAESLPTLQEAVSSAIEALRPSGQKADILERLAQTSRDAEPLASLPLRPFDETRKGFIEAICTEDQESSLTWIIGWTSGGNLHDTPVVFVDGRKFHGAMLACKYLRVDLPPGAMGFVGVVQCDWRARQTSKPILYYGNSLRSHLMSVSDLPRVSKRDILHHIEQHRDGADRLGWMDLRQAVAGQDSWLIESGDRLDVQVGVDRLILAPHFGCFASGWVMSYARAVEGFALKMGSSVMSMDGASLIIRPRPDLSAAFPGSENLTERAGFTCFFPGDPDLSSSEKPLLKILLQHGSSMIHSVGPTHVRVLGQSEALDSLLHLFPSLETERFFPSFVAAVRREYIKRCDSLDVNELRKTKKALVVVIPSTHDDCRLAFEEIRHNVPQCLDQDTGLIVLAAQAFKHIEIDSLFRELRSNLSIQCSMVYVPEIMASFYVLQNIILMAGVDRFCFVAANDVLTQDGWEAVARFLTSNKMRAIILESVDPETLLKSRNKSLSFGCEWETLKQLSSMLEVQIGSQPSPAGCLSEICTDLIEVVKAGAFFTRVATPSRVARLINLFDKDAARAFAS